MIGSHLAHLLGNVTTEKREAAPKVLKRDDCKYDQMGFNGLDILKYVSLVLWFEENVASWKFKIKPYTIASN